MRVVVFLTLQLLCSAYAFWRGGAPERTIAGAMLAAIALDFAIHAAAPINFSRLDYTVFGIDLALLGVIGMVAIHANRFWPIWMMSVQVVAVGMHVARALSPAIAGEAYGILTAGWSYLMLLLLAFGTWRHRRRLVHFGDDPAWSTPPPVRFGES